MKKPNYLLVYLILHLILTSEMKAQSGWYWQNPLPQGNALRSVKFISSTDGWAVGDAGTILNTVDGGTTWISQTSETTNPLYGVCFTDVSNGTAVGGIVSKLVENRS